jgi:hypothetical protein
MIIFCPTTLQAVAGLRYRGMKDEFRKLTVAAAALAAMALAGSRNERTVRRDGARVRPQAVVRTSGAAALLGAAIDAAANSLHLVMEDAQCALTVVPTAVAMDRRGHAKMAALIRPSRVG